MQPTITHQPDQHRFVAELDGARGNLAYELGDGLMTITHTHVASELEGRGVGAALVEAALDLARRQGLKVRPVCSYANAYMKKHPEADKLRA
ncbi:N-acetyltransferase [Schlegelella sp. ID0723]|uniref:N-acetyltransferase n=1 Tax=Piscinibacter koreensis TaxID=2742824 RepID=A0A7Y6TY41_9BURK|nr:GNAT family N-acetyltransferase [Schlegelella koreensis]NUZ07833.1 N-acetyltransferase [Schlegelella koreensis]